MKVLKTLKYKVWDKERQCYDEDVSVSQDGLFFEVQEGWNMEGGGGSIDLDQDRYEVHLDSKGERK